MSLNPLGMSSGMDINSMVSKIVDAERVPKQQRIDNERTQIDASISAYGRLRESLDTMKNLMTSFRQDKAFAVRKVESSDESAVSATATTEAIAGKYAVDVLQLAQSHKVASQPMAEDLEFGPGKLHIQLGDKKFTVDVADKSDLKDVLRGINGASGNPGVRASVINDKDGKRLIVASERSGAENQIKISVDSGATNPLKKFEYKTLEERIESLEKARIAAREALDAPLQGDESQSVVDGSTGILDSDSQGDEPENTGAAENVLAQSSVSTDGSDLSQSAAQTAYLPPEERIPGWTETASGTLLDSYEEPEPELDQKALDKMSDVPGWTNTASGTLTDSYMTPEEAKAVREADLAEKRAEVAAEKAAIEDAVSRGELTDDEAEQLLREQMSPEERVRQDKINDTQAALKAAEDSMSAYSGMTEVQQGQDALVMLDGVAQLSSGNNVIEDAVEGIDITVKGVTDPAQKSAEIGVEYDRNGVREDIEQFVTAYNNFYQTSRQLAVSDPATGQKGPLAGDSIIRSAESRLQSVFNGAISQAPDDLKTLKSFGITSTRQGTLEINYDLLDRQLNKNFNHLESFFGGRDGFAKRVEDAIQGLTGASGMLRTREDTLRERNYRLDDNQAALDRRIDSLEQRTHDKFAAMQDATAKMQSQLSGMMSALG
ncbi:flagellar filament capping protein FliD [Vibrio sp. HA2012]|uniref:flagellar filament capping protein FliD n=1 Tax=Vibrio sp. HA2012 TaxID=1971595 RepID=UPI000C2C9D8D|nr:flagellar filament capping protein FliD [Vibrio sp. HA2012]PJC88275.1 flagellar filament capping protein FliD [Vibrio sp. HA2012]